MSVATNPQIEENAPELEKLFNLFSIFSSENVSDNEIDNAIIGANEILEGPNGWKLLNSKELWPYLVSGLESNVLIPVKRFCINELQRFGEQESSLFIFEDPRLFSKLLCIIAEDDLGNSEKVSSLLSKMCQYPLGLNVVFHSNSIASFRKIMNSHNETVRFRVLALFARIAPISSAAFLQCQKNGFLDDIVSLIDSTDILEKLNAIELLDQVASIHEGSAFLEQSNVLTKLKEFISSSSSLNKDSFTNLLVARIVSFLGNFSTKGDYELSLLEKHSIPSTLSFLLKREKSVELTESLITAIGQIASSNLGLEMLKGYSSLLDELVSFVSSDRNRFQICCFHSLAFMLKKLSRNSTSSTNQILESLLHRVPKRNGDRTNILNVVLPLLHTNPFIELRNATFDLLDGMASHGFSAEELLNYSGFYDYIKNRSIEETKTGKEWKYKIIQTLLETSNSHASILSSSRRNELENYLKEGVFYMKSEASMVEVDTKLI